MLGLLLCSSQFVTVDLSSVLFSEAFSKNLSALTLCCFSDVKQLVCCFMQLFKNSCFCFQLSFLEAGIRLMFAIGSYSLDKLGNIQYWEGAT